jgi:PAS domain S-box-containing protein
MDTLKYTMTDLKDKNVFDFIDENQMDNFKENWRNLWKGTPFHGQFITRTKYNEVKWLRSSYTPVPDMYGEFSKVVQISYEMTKEKMMEIETQKQTEQLKLQEEKLRASGKELSKRLEEARIEMKNQFQEIEKIKIRNERTLEGALDAIITIDNNGIVQFFNKAAEDLWGIKRMDILNKKVKDLFSDEIINSDEFINNYIDPSKEKIVGKRQEVKITAKNGEDVPVLMLLSDAKIGNEHWFTAFIQNIEVELF